MPDIMAIGDVVVEFLGTQLDQRFSETGSFDGPFESGSAAIFVDQAARAGVSSGIFAKVGRDGFAQLVMDRLQKDGVSLRGIKRSECTPTGANFVTYNSNGTRQYIFHYANSAMGEMSPEDVEEEMLDGCKYMFFSGSNAMATPSMWQASLRCVEYAMERGVKIVFDPNVRAELHKGYLKKLWEPLISRTSIFLGSESELMALSEAQSVEEGLAAAHFCEMEIIVLKYGAQGSRVLAGGQDIYIPPYQVRETDPTGAGDSFAGAFLAQLCKGEAIERAALFANAAGALHVTRPGPMSCPSYEEIMDLMERQQRRK